MIKWASFIIGLVIALFCAAPAYSAEEGLTEFLVGCDAPTNEFYRRRQFGTTEMADRLLELILTGEKTATFATPWLYEGDRNATPVVGGYTVVNDSTGAPRALLRTTHVITLPFGQITQAHTQYEGPGARPLDAWRQIHRDFWGPALRRQGKEVSETTPVTVERFEVVCAN